ncbi:orotidine 5'-phosphate decarboxylase [Amniculicola lignicola CBS 123094]|uniref:Orotidine 5'-phosphate decarboxylase n=1 Tax=Amniculicola lignicola CBS 123094 TaxID=1392246 RepID=A0A6A5WJP4_9PLEO|nr:orotidine 5'-phosphate decarboxylase [Amniculicola lignicola CBS 123094]
MASLSSFSYTERASRRPHPVARRFLETAETKQSNLIISADLTTTVELLKCADKLGPYIAVFKTHIDIVVDFGVETVRGLKELAKKHNFLIFEDRKFVDIGSTVQKQYHGGALRISEFADIVNMSVLGGDGIVEALSQVVSAPNFSYPDERAFILPAEMTSRDSLATNSYTAKCVDLARDHKQSVIGFVATRSLESVPAASSPSKNEDFLIFITSVNQKSKADKLGQQYQTPTDAIDAGSDFIIVRRGIYAAEVAGQSARAYQKEGWAAYLKRIGKS